MAKELLRHVHLVGLPLRSLGPAVLLRHGCFAAPVSAIVAIHGHTQLSVAACDSLPAMLLLRWPPSEHACCCALPRKGTHA